MGTTRADQVRDVAERAGLPGEVGDVLALAATGIDATFQVTYTGEGGSTLVVYQDPPNRRVDIVAGGRVVESSLFRGAVAYRCTRSGDDADAPLECTRSQGALDAPGPFSADALEQFAEELGAAEGVQLEVEERTVADVGATCLVATPRAGPTDGTGPGSETICLSEEGAQLLLDVGGERVVAEAYGTDVPDGIFDV